VPPDEVSGLVPEGVRSRHHAFWRCPACGRVYWQGTHWDKMIARLNDLDLSADAVAESSRGKNFVREKPS
jgi:uncharacterized protein with PIN domain